MKVNVHLVNMLQAALQHLGSVWGIWFGFGLEGGRDFSLDVLWLSYHLGSVLPSVLFSVCHFSNLSAFSVLAMNWVGLTCIVFKRQD